MENDEEFLAKKQIVTEFLEKLSAMMMDEVTKHWPRFKEYFELWI